MKKMLFTLALLLPVAAGAQTFAGRASAEFDYKIRKGLHITAEEEIRSGDDFGSLGSLRTGLGLSYKPAKFLKLSAGYILINPWKVDKDGYTGFWAPRHRFYADARGSLDWGDFQFFLKERLQLTHNADASLNLYQNTRNALALKSRIGVKYKGWKRLEPSLYFELRTALNDPWGSTSGSAKTNSSGREYYDYAAAGYTHVYNDRYRGFVGLDWNISKRHTLSPYVLLDYVSEYEIDTNSKGTRLFSAGYENLFRITLGLGYKFSF